MTAAVVALVALASMSFGLRATSLFLDDASNRWGRLAAATVVGALISGVVLQVSANYRVLEFGVGLLLSLSPVGVYDLAKWWFRSRRRH